MGGRGERKGERRKKEEKKRPIILGGFPTNNNLSLKNTTKNNGFDCSCYLRFIVSVVSVVNVGCDCVSRIK